jgi:benzodiazapine receptor
MIMPVSRRISLVQVANVAAFVVMVATNLIALFWGINGKTTAQISDAYPTLFTPAGYVFSIWSVIYLLLLVFIVYQFLPSDEDKSYLDRVGYLFVLSCAANVVWLFLWHYEMIVLSVGLMAILLASLIAIYLRLGIGKTKVSRGQWIAVHVPFSVYLGWITVATIADVSSSLVSIGWGGFGIAQAVWADIMIIVALVVTLAVIMTRKDVPYALVVAWATVGILVKQGAEQSIAVISGGAAIVILIVSALVATGLADRILGAH